jgi:hypothetical protein
MNIKGVTISFPRFGIVRFHLTNSGWDYLDCCRDRAANMLRILKRMDSEVGRVALRGVSIRGDSDYIVSLAKNLLS